MRIPLYALMAAGDVGGLIQLIIAAVIIIGSAIAGILSKAREQSDQSEPGPHRRPEGSAPGVPRRPTMRRREPPLPARPPRPIRPASPPPRRTAMPVPSARIPQVRPHKLTGPSRPRPVQPTLAETPEPPPPHLQISPLPSETTSQQAGPPTSPLPTKPAVQRKHWSMGRTRIRQAVIYAELLEQPLALRPERLW
jgi:hypothetical protein